VDVDRAALQPRAELGAEDLHVARQHHQVDARASTSASMRCSCARLVAARSGGQRQVVEGDAVAVGQRGESRGGC
jgi:hypothetical protein